MNRPATEWVSDRQLSAYAARLERANLRARGSSLTRGSIARAVRIIETRDNGALHLVPGDWREAMKARASE